MAISPQEYLNMYRARKPIQIIHPWLRGTRKDVIDVLTYLKRRFLAGWIEDVGAAFLSTISETAKKVTSALGLTSEEQRQATMSTASVMKNYTQSLIDKINWLANRYSQPGTYIKYGERGTHVKTLQEVINILWKKMAYMAPIRLTLSKNCKVWSGLKQMVCSDFIPHKHLKVTSITRSRNQRGGKSC